MLPGLCSRSARLNSTPSIPQRGAQKKTNAVVNHSSAGPAISSQPHQIPTLFPSCKHIFPLVSKGTPLELPEELALFFLGARLCPSKQEPLSRGDPPSDSRFGQPCLRGQTFLRFAQRFSPTPGVPRPDDPLQPASSSLPFLLGTCGLGTLTAASNFAFPRPFYESHQVTFAQGTRLIYCLRKQRVYS